MENQQPFPTDPTTSLYVLQDRPPASACGGPDGQPMPTFAEVVETLSGEIHKAAFMESRCRERLRQLRAFYGRIPTDPVEIRELTKDSPCLRTATGERDYGRSVAELNHFSELREWYRKRVEAGQGDERIRIPGFITGGRRKEPRGQVTTAGGEPVDLGGGDDFIPF